MNFEKFQTVLEAGKYSKDERIWFPKTYSRFREFLVERELLPGDVNRGEKTQKGDILLFRLSGASAWSERGLQSELDWTSP